MSSTVLATLSPQPRLSPAESIVFSVVSGGSCGGTARSIQVCRAALQEAVQEHCPQLLRYNTLCYHGPGNLYAIEGGKVVATVTIPCNHGVWQGDSIGSHNCLGMLKFFQKLASELQPHTAFNHQSAGVPFSAIIDDVTLVPRRRHVLTVLDFILQEAPKHGQVPNLRKTVVWLRKGSLRSDLARQLM